MHYPGSHPGQLLQLVGGCELQRWMRDPARRLLGQLEARCLGGNLEGTRAHGRGLCGRAVHGQCRGGLHDGRRAVCWCRAWGTNLVACCGGDRVRAIPRFLAALV